MEQTAQQLAVIISGLALISLAVVVGLAREIYQGQKKNLPAGTGRRRLKN